MARRAAHYSDGKLYDDYYVGQVGHGMPYFSGTQIQRGHGLGNLLSGLVRAAMPLVKSGMKALGKKGLKTGVQIAGDVIRGKKPKRAAKRRAKQAATQLLTKAFGPPGKKASRGRQQSGRGRRGIKRGASSRSGSRVQSKQPRDIFS